jgi:hypothetical protein
MENSVKELLKNVNLSDAKPNVDNDYKFLGELGSGVTSTVYLAVNLQVILFVN